MSSSRNTSPRSAKASPRQLRPRSTTSVGSPARSNASGIRTSQDADTKKNRISFVDSPLPNRKSILTDNTYIDHPSRKSWWKTLGENSRDVIEVLSINEPVTTNNVAEEYVVLSQEKNNYTLDLPESSDNESINSIVVPQKKLFTQQPTQNKTNFNKIIGTRDTLAKMNKTNLQTDLHEKSIKVTKKNLFNLAPKISRPPFPEALLAISPNKTAANKTKEMVQAEVKGQVKTLFGNRPATKRKNMFVDFIVSESEDEISDIQPRVFGFPKKSDVRRISSTSRGTRDLSPTSSLGVDMDDWKLLPSSTIIENEIEEMMMAPTSVKKARLSELCTDRDVQRLEEDIRIVNDLVQEEDKNENEQSVVVDDEENEQSVVQDKNENEQSVVEDDYDNEENVEVDDDDNEENVDEDNEENEQSVEEGNDDNEQIITEHNETEQGSKTNNLSTPNTSHDTTGRNRRKVVELPSDPKYVLTPNITHDTTGRHRRKDNERSPEVILQNLFDKADSFTMKGRNTSIRKTKSMIKQISIKPSLALARDSADFSDGNKNSSTDTGSGWDSHRTTRKTLRQTMGKDFSPRKSLRALVMEKSAKRFTAMSEINDDHIRMPQANSTQYPEPMVINDDEETDISDAPVPVHEVSKRTRQATLEMYLQSIKNKNHQNRIQIEVEIKNSLQNSSKENTNYFIAPSKSGFRQAKHKLNTKSQQNKPKAKKIKSAIIPFEDLPINLLEDMKYKPPKRYKPGNASWITKRLYNFLESKLEAKYDYKARIRAEKLLETIYTFTKDLRRHPVAPKAANDVLKMEMAKLKIVQTHFDFYNFFHEYMPREVRVKVVPDLVNKLAVPKHGVFTDILK